MKRVVEGITAGLIVVGICLCLLPERAQAAGGVLITAIQTGSSTSASEEYVRLSNTGTVAVDLTGWRLEYFAASPKSFSTPTRTIALSGSALASSEYIVASTGYMADQAAATFAPTLAAAGGHLRLVGGATEQDFVGWGTATQPQNQAAPAPAAGQVLVRKQTAEGYVSTNNNAADFEIAGQSSVSPAVEQEDAQLILSELLPNPASPVTDAAGEFIELYNPNDATVNLSGYKMLVGATLSRAFTFKDQTIGAGQHKAFYSAETKLTLANAGGRVQLQTPNGTVLDDTTYGTAADGQAWAWSGGDWQWTSQSTPGSPNTIAAITVPSKPTKATTKKSTAKSSTKAAKVKGASTSKPGVSAAEQDASSPAPMHVGVLAGVGGLALLYGAYEYRTDITNTFHKFRRHRRDRQEDRS